MLQSEVSSVSPRHGTGTRTTRQSAVFRKMKSVERASREVATSADCELPGRHSTPPRHGD